MEEGVSKPRRLLYSRSKPRWMPRPGMDRSESLWVKLPVKALPGPEKSASVASSPPPFPSSSEGLGASLETVTLEKLADACQLATAEAAKGPAGDWLGMALMVTGDRYEVQPEP